jgi:DNA-binding transcriptional MerR regulator
MKTTRSRPNRKTGPLAGYLEPEELAAALDVALDTLKRWHRVGEGPPLTKIGRHRLYAPDSVREWLKSREQKAGSQYEQYA